MDIKQIKKLIDVVRQNGVAELEVKEDNESIHIVLNRETSTVTGMVSGCDVSAVRSGVDGVSRVAHAFEDEDSAHADKTASGSVNFAPEDIITSPMVGTVYLSSSPDSNVFVNVGDAVQVGDTLCLIEAMKMFNRIEATKNGVVTHVLVQDAQSVEYGQQLFVIE